ncbi:MAG: RHS repeat-associated core domain-containing protein [Negativicutes bacterium]|nr:RHS repeat-associated core domain-containing protein [Negativicutes bacterium]
MLHGDTSVSGAGVLNLANFGTDYYSSSNAVLEIWKDKFGHFGLGDGCDDATKAPGQGSWVALGPGCNGDTNRISLRWNVSLGRSFDGLAAGQLAFAEAGLSRGAYTPSAIYYNGFMTNLYATETLLATNAPTYVTNSDDTITTNLFIPVQSQNLWAQVTISTNPATIPDADVEFCATYVTNADDTITTNQFVTVASEPVWTQIINLAPTDTSARLYPSIALYTNCLVPVVLVQSLVPYAVTNSAGQLYTNYDMPIRQLKAYQTFVDVVAPDTNQTILRFYHASDVGQQRDYTGLYTHFAHGPFVTYTIQNPEPATASKLNIIETRDGNSSTQSLVKASSPTGVTWTLTLGAGAEQRLETRKVSFVGSPTPTDRIESNSIAYASNPDLPAFQCQETYHYYPWGWELKETKVPGNTADLVTTYDYYDDPNEQVQDSDTGLYGAWGYGQLKSIKYPDGYWEKRVYNSIDCFAEGEQRYYAGEAMWTSYYPGLLHYMFHPYLDGRDGGAASPDQASPFNTSFIIIGYGEENGMLDTGARLATTWDGVGQAMVNNQTTEIWDAKPDFADDTTTSANVSLIDSVDTWVGYGSVTTDHASTAPLGLSGHPCAVNNHLGVGHPSTIHYYDHGTFQASTGSFTVAPTNHLFDASTVNQFPDFCETMYNMNGERILPAGDYYESLDGHVNGDEGTSWDESPLGSRIGPEMGIELFPNQSVKQSKIYRGGDLAATEQFVYAGALGGQSGYIIDDNPNWKTLNRYRYYNDSLGRATNIDYVDVITGQARTVYSADYRGAGNIDGELLLSETDDTGVKHIYGYDALKRVSQMTLAGHGSQPDQVVQYAYNADGMTLFQTTTSSDLTQTRSWAYDMSGRITNQVDESGIAIQTSYSANSRVITTIHPGDITSIQTLFPDRRPQSLSGSGVVNQYYSYNCFNDEIGLPMANQRTFFGRDNSPRWENQAKDCYGLDAWNERPAASGTANTIWQHKISYRNGWLSFISSSDGNPISSYKYDLASGNVSMQQEQPYYSGIYNEETFCATAWLTTSDPGGAVIDPSQFRVSTSDTFIVQIGGRAFRATTNDICLKDNAADRTVQSIHLEQLNGFAAGETARTFDFDADGNETITTTTVERDQNRVTVSTCQTNTSAQTATAVYQNGRVISASTLSVAKPTLYSYDSLGRTNLIEDPQENDTRMTYDSNTGWMTGVIDPAGHTTTYDYYGVTEANAGKLKCRTDANLRKTYFSYTPQGQLYQTWGDVPYPAEYRYNEFGDLTNLITFRGGSGWTGSSWPNPDYNTGDNTYWVYDPASGALLSKMDAQGRSVNYTYDITTGRLLTRSWGRTVAGVPVTVTNCYNGFGELTKQDYNDGTPTVQLDNYNRAGQPREIVDGAGTCELTYDGASRLLSSTYGAGPLAGVTIANHFDWRYGRDSVKVLGLGSEGTTTLEDDYGYDPNSGRLATVSSGGCSANYSYVPNSDLLQSTTFKNGSTTVLTTTRSWNYGFQLASIANAVDGKPVTSHAYTYDNVNRRTEAKLEDGSAWNYNYNDRNELTGANRYWYDSRPVSGQQFGYNYDNIGNRTWAQFGGDTNGNNLQTISYAANSLNQYTSIVTPGLQDIIGAALATNCVTVNGGVGDRHGEYFHRQISIANTNQPVWQNVTNISGIFANHGGLLFPANNQTLVYDADGNLLSDGIWVYQWDGENRLISMWTTNNGIANLASSNCLRLDFAYDGMGRRVQKIVSVWIGSSFIAQSTNHFIYDGWNTIAVLNSQSAIAQSFMWGNDLSGTMNEAGGVGGLLMAEISGTNCFATYDGNGNITALINAVGNSTVARYEYSPFGQLIRATGPLAMQNPLTFSTKYRDQETGLFYYPNRFYNPESGRWLSRDQGNDPNSINLYCFALNSPNGTIDPDGNGAISQFGRLAFLSIITAVKYYQQAILTPDPEQRAVWVERGNEALHGMAETGEKNAKDAEAIERIAIERVKGIKIANFPNRWAGKGKNLARNGGRLGRSIFVPLAVGMMVGAAYQEAEAGAVDHLAGDDRSATSQMYRDLDNGDDAYADLDAIISAAESTGSTDEGALIAVAVNFEAEEVYSSPGSASQNPYADVSSESYDTITIKQ